MKISPDTEIQFIKGVGPKRAAHLSRIGISTVGDLLFHFPIRYEDRSNILPIENLQEGDFATVKGKIATARSMKRGRGLMFQMTIRDETGLMSCLWFSVKGDYLKKKYQPGLEIIASGRVAFSRYQKCFEMTHPDIELIEDGENVESGGIIPVYPLTEGLNQSIMRKIVATAVENAPTVAEILPKHLIKKLNLPERNKALKEIHNPGDKEDTELLASFRSPAHKRMIFEEFFIIESAMAMKRNRDVTQAKGVKITVDKNIVPQIVSAFPFELTQDQRDVLNEISTDLESEHPMNRLLQGDVGCGKTAVAAITMMLAIAKGHQAVLMAPTEILAEQHYKNISILKTGIEFKTALLTSGMKNKEKEELKTKIANGEIDLVVGTHAVIQRDVAFSDLGVVVIDEQHRFGVKQRAELISKGLHPNSLIMTATPIPRTLAMTLYSDLDISIIKNSPKGRGEVETKVIKPGEKQKANILLHKEIKKGRQAYIIYPLVEESEKSDLKAATEMYELYSKKIFQDLRIGLVHGRMKPAEKNGVMHSFMNKEIDILISTTVVEVGIDQPNATVMMVEHAERFGLAQLHQLRGRVGRGAEKSYCLLAVEYPITDIARERLKVMTLSTDGFLIAEKDLELRGTGDLFGTKQSGLPTFRIANLLRDFDLLKLAKEEAFEIIKKDPHLTSPENIALKKELETNWKDQFSLGDVG